MLSRKQHQEPELLPGADPEADCQTPSTGPDAPTTVPPAGDPDQEDHEHDITWDGLPGQAQTPAGRSIESWQIRRQGWAYFLERLALVVERPVNRLTGGPQFNPLYHTGTIAVFLLGIVGITGLYLFFFFQFDFELSYNAVVRMESQLIARTIRALHRYASGALIITVLLHAFRTLFLEQFRGPRWLAWLTGVVMTFLLWLGGVSGYWLIWDERAQLITDSFTDFLEATTSLAPAFVVRLSQAENQGPSWPVILLIFAVHVIVFLITAGAFWLHIRRLSRPKWLPNAQWTVGMGLVLLLGSLLFPVGTLQPADSSQLPGAIDFDPVFLFYLPLTGTSLLNWLWLTLAAVTVGLAALPWLSPGKQKSQPKVRIIKERCTGCTKCALDCPYQAITMVERHDDKPHKFIAIEDPSLCVSCGICIGSCDGVAVTMGATPPEMLWESVSARLALAQARLPAGEKAAVIYTCERHASHGARPFLDAPESPVVIPLPCVGTAPPDLLVRTLAAGAGEVKIVGCPPDDCINREGNYWTEQRITRQRVPRLKRTYAQAPITAAWLPPDDFAQAVISPKNIPLIESGPQSGQPDYLASRRMFQRLSWRNLAPAFAVLAVALLIQVFATALPLTVHGSDTTLLQVVLADLTEPLGRPGKVADTWEMQLRVDEQTVFRERFTGEMLSGDGREERPFFNEYSLAPGSYHLQLLFFNEAGQNTIYLFDEQVELAAGQILQMGYVPAKIDNCWRADCP